MIYRCSTTLRSYVTPSHSLSTKLILLPRQLSIKRDWGVWMKNCRSIWFIHIYHLYSYTTTYESYGMIDQLRSFKTIICHFHHYQRNQFRNFNKFFQSTFLENFNHMMALKDLLRLATWSIYMIHIIWTILRAEKVIWAINFETDLILREW